MKIFPHTLYSSIVITQLALPDVFLLMSKGCPLCSNCSFDRQQGHDGSWVLKHSAQLNK